MTTLDPRILSTSLPPDMADIVETMARNVDAHVEAILTRFRRDLATRIQGMVEGRWDAELQRQLDGIDADVRKQVEAAITTAHDLAEAARKARELATAAGPTALRNAVEHLQSETETLEKSLTHLRSTVSGLSARIGTTVGGAAAKMVGV